MTNKQKQMQQLSLVTQIPQISLAQESCLAQVQKLCLIKNQILLKVQLLNNLNNCYKQKYQHIFIQTFTKIMSQLSDELHNAIQAYKNIDKEIQEDKKCMGLMSQLRFFQQEARFMQDQYQGQLVRLNQLKHTNAQLKLKQREIKLMTRNSHQRLVKSTRKNQLLSLRLNSLFIEQNCEQKTFKKKKQVKRVIKEVVQANSKSRCLVFCHSKTQVHSRRQKEVVPSRDLHSSSYIK